LIVCGQFSVAVSEAKLISLLYRLTRRTFSKVEPEYISTFEMWQRLGAILDHSRAVRETVCIVCELLALRPPKSPSVFEFLDLS